MRNWSLMRRIAMRLAMVTAATLVATVALLAYQFSVSTGVTIQRDLPIMLKGVREALRVGPDGRFAVDLSPALRAEFDDHYFFTVSDEAGAAYLSTPPGRGHAYHPFEPNETDRPQYFEHRYTESDSTYVGVTQHVRVEGRDAWVQVVEEVPYWSTLTHYSIEVFVEGFGVLAVLHLLATAGLSYAAVRSTMQPVREAAMVARRVVPGDPSTRLPVGRLPVEVAPLARAVNDAFDRLHDALEAQKRFTAEAAHELMTPLAVLRGRAEEAPEREFADALIFEIDELATMARQLLELAELDSLSAPPADRVDLRMIAKDVVGRLAPRAIKAGIEPRVVAGERPVIVRGCSRALGSAIANLVRNAIAHATGATFIEVGVTADGRVRVCDDGPGVPVEQRERLFDRFHHGANANGAHHGLGLAIVKRIAEAHRGELAAGDRPGGRGACFELRLPLA